MIHIENIFYLLKKLDMAERKDLESFFDVFATSIADLVGVSLSDEEKIIWSDEKYALSFDPTGGKFLYIDGGGRRINLSSVSTTVFWNCAKRIINWISDMSIKLEKILKEREETIKQFYNIKSDMIKLEKEHKMNLGMGFYKEEKIDD